MTGILRPNRLILSIGVFLVVGLALTGLVDYYTTWRCFQTQLDKEILPLTGEAITAQVEQTLLSMVSRSEALALDTFFEKQIAAGEQHPEEISRHLRSWQQNNGTLALSFVSATSHRHYTHGGEPDSVQPKEPADDWFFRIRALPDAYEIETGVRPEGQKTPTIIISHKVHGQDGTYIGAVRCTFPVTSIQEILESQTRRFGTTVFFVNGQGRVVLSGSPKMPPFHFVRDIEPIHAVLNSPLPEPQSLHYVLNHRRIALHARLIPELNWFLFIEKPVRGYVLALWPGFLLTGVIFLGTGVLICGICAFFISSYQTKLDSMATTDELTQLTNRHAFEPVFEHALRESDRNHLPLSIALFDVDHFKELNDLHGHLAGNAVLISVAESISQEVRGTDCLCRWGGEEFLLLLKGSNLQSGYALVDKIRQDIQETTIIYENTPIHVQVSIGIVEKQKEEDMEWLIQRIDQALYLAKNKGRNRVETI